MSKLITVFGATGNQGGSVIRELQAHPTLSKEFKIRGITRDVSKPAAQKLKASGVEVVSADMSSASSLSQAVQGSHTVFLVTNYWETAQAAVEIAQGKAVADAAKAAGVRHLVFSSLLHVTNETKGRLSHVPHFDGKADIEAYIKASGVPSSFVLPGYFMSNYLGMLKRGDDDGTYTLAYPVAATARFPLFAAAEDTGKFVAAAMVAHESGALPDGGQVLAAAGYYTPDDVIATFEQVTGKKAKFVQVSAEQYKGFLPPFMAEEMLENHLFIEDPGYFAGRALEPSLKLVEDVGLKPTSFKEFVEANKAAWN